MNVAKGGITGGQGVQTHRTRNNDPLESFPQNPNQPFYVAVIKNDIFFKLLVLVVGKIGGLLLCPAGALHASGRKECRSSGSASST